MSWPITRSSIFSNLVQENDFLQDHFETQAKIKNSNNANWSNFWKNIGYHQTFLRHESRTDSEVLDGDIVKLVTEDSVTTASGFFGYNEHELISRYFMLYRTLDDHTLMWSGGNSPELFRKPKPQPVPEAINRLIANSGIAEGVHRMEILHLIHRVIDFVKLADSAESCCTTRWMNILTAYNRLRLRSRQRHRADSSEATGD